jgi:hypothetical protein
VEAARAPRGDGGTDGGEGCAPSAVGGGSAQFELDPAVGKESEAVVGERRPEPVAEQVEQSEPVVRMDMSAGLERVAIELSCEATGGALLLAPGEARLARLGLKVSDGIIAVGLVEQAHGRVHPAGAADDARQNPREILLAGLSDAHEGDRAALLGEDAVWEDRMVM